MKNMADAYLDHAWPVTIQVAQGAIALLKAGPPARILDLACGCGASTAAMALMGFDVTAIDCEPTFIETARQMSSLKGATVNWICQDMRSIAYESEFDYICLRDVIFGIFKDEGEDIDMIRRIARALKPPGGASLRYTTRNSRSATV